MSIRLLSGSDNMNLLARSLVTNSRSRSEGKDHDDNNVTPVAGGGQRKQQKGDK
jgi:hypothetical protein